MRFFAFLVYGIIAVTFAISCINYALLYCGIASILEILEYNTYNKPIKLLLLLPGVNSPWYRINSVHFSNISCQCIIIWKVESAEATCTQWTSLLQHDLQTCYHCALQVSPSLHPSYL